MKYLMQLVCHGFPLNWDITLQYIKLQSGEESHSWISLTMANIVTFDNNLISAQACLHEIEEAHFPG